jgi:2-polyprenyl-6-methoxyphenol hydroxylase-like FAD-dependent oxidoreductase
MGARRGGRDRDRFGRVQVHTVIRNTDILVVGAGPTGLVLALWLARLGVRVRIVDKLPAPATTTRAIAVQARTLELYRQIGIADAVVERGRTVTRVNLWVAGRQAAHAAFGNIGADISPYPYVLIFSQDEHERLRVDRLREAGVDVERRTELVDFEQTDDGIVARLKSADGRIESCEAAYIAGCDGAHSAVRETLAIGFPGGTYAHLFYVADVDARGSAINGEVHVALDRTDFLALFPMTGDHRVRLVGTVRDDAAHRHEELSWNDVSKRVIEWMRLDVDRVNWFSTYRVHHRVADRFRSGRAFLLGDAAHIHSPVGGQGMNTGIGDAVNVAWKIAAVLHGNAPRAILDTYEPERIAFARRLVATTDQAFVAVTSPSVITRTLRLRVVPFVIPALFALPAARRLLFRTVSQTAVNYPNSALSEGRAGRIYGGDRLPWLRVDSTDNFAPLMSLDWQVHVYGRASPELQAVCTQHSLPLHVFSWQPKFSRAGVLRHAVYLVRPDGYVALARTDGSATAIASYLAARKLPQTTHE